MWLAVPKFSGVDPESWIFAINEYFSLLNTPADQRLRIVSFNLEGAVAEWFQWMTKNGLITTCARVTDIPDFLLISFYISWLKLHLMRELLVSKPTTLGDVFSLARTIEARFDDQAAPVAGMSAGLEANKVVNNDDDSKSLGPVIPSSDSESSGEVKVLNWVQQAIDVESTSDNNARHQARELETKVLVDGKQDEEKVVDVADEQNSNEPDVLEVHKEEKDEGCNAKKIMRFRNQDNFFRHHLEDKVVFDGVESVTPVLQEDGRPKRPQWEKSKPENQSRVLFKTTPRGQVVEAVLGKDGGGKFGGGRFGGGDDDWWWWDVKHPPLTTSSTFSVYIRVTNEVTNSFRFNYPVPPVHHQQRYGFRNSRHMIEYVTKFQRVATVHPERVSRHTGLSSESYYMVQGSMKIVLECLLTLKAHFMPNVAIGSPKCTSPRSWGVESSRWKQFDEQSGTSDSLEEELSPRKFQMGLRSPIISEPTSAYTHHAGHKFHEVFQMKHGGG
nr:kinesin-like protein KIN-14C [Tanacetum cinerariifolium]